MSRSPRRAVAEVPDHDHGILISGPPPNPPADGLGALEAALEGDTWDGGVDALAAARRDAAAVLSADPTADVKGTRVAFAGALLAHLAAAEQIAGGPAILAHLAENERARAVLDALRNPVICALPLPVALAACGGLLTLVGAVDGLSAWRPDPAGRLTRIHGSIGDRDDQGGRELGRAAIASATVRSADGLAACPVIAFSLPAAVLVYRPGEHPGASGMVRAAASALTPALQQAMTADRNYEGQRALTQAPERRLTRLALDIHDGALQDVALIAGQLRRLEDVLRPIAAGTAAGDGVRAVLESVAELVAALDTDLREVTTSLEGPSILRRPFADALDGVVEHFRAHSETAVAVVVTGAVDAITHSQRIALFRIVQESLSNVREHSGADHVRISIDAGTAQTTAWIEDDGVGFNPPEVLAAAARAGRLGIAGMVERVRLLGGTIDILSRPGDGTTVRAALAHYEPIEDRRGGGNLV
jgi:signal transduction histidine kinase